MKTRSGMPYDVVAFSTDELALQLSDAQEGVYHRLMRHSWLHGSLPCDFAALAAIARVTIDRFTELWAFPLESMWTVHAKLTNRLVSEKQESERRFVVRHARQEERNRLALSKRQSEKGVKSGIARRSKLNHGSTTVEPTHEPDASRNEPPSPPHPNPPLSPIIINNSSIQVRPPPNGRARDLAADWFADRCLELTGSPYVSESGDFVQLARLRKGFKLPSREKPPGWDDAVTNYFASPLSQYSLADLANPKRYAVFKNSPLNEFKVPVNHQKAQGETHEQRKERVRQENLQSVLSRIAESGEPSLKPGTERGANGDLHRIAGKSQ